MFRPQLVHWLIHNSVRRLSVLALAASWLLILPSAADAFDVIQITDNSTDDGLPDISGSNVVWHGCDGGTVVFPDTCSGGDYEIYMATITEPVPSLSFGGLALLAGLVLGIVGWARWGS